MNEFPSAGRGRLVILCGLPGSGKTTLARKIEGERGAIRLCSDDWMTRLLIDLFDEAAREAIEALQKDLAIQLVQAGCNVVFESGGWTRNERDELRLRCRKVGGIAELIYLQAPLEKLWERVALRNAGLPYGTPAISRTDLEKWWALFEVPDAEELSHYAQPSARITEGSAAGTTQADRV